MILGVSVFKKIYEIVVDEGSEGDVRGNQEPDSLFDCHFQMPLGFGQLGNSIERSRATRLVELEMLACIYDCFDVVIFHILRDDADRF